MRSGGIDGIGSYTRELLRRVADEPGIQVQPVAWGRQLPRVPDDTGFKVQGLGSFSASLAWSCLTGNAFAGARAMGQRIDLMHATDHLIPDFGRVPVVATICDAIPLSHPQWVSKRLRGLKNALWRRSAQGAAHIITISEFSRSEISRHFGIAPEGITAIPLGVDARWSVPVPTAQKADALARHGIDRPYLLIVGTLQPRKNIERALAAWHSLGADTRAHARLVIVGRTGWRCDALVEGLRAQRWGPSVQWLRYLAGPDLIALMQGATGLIVPSLYEGFGLPVLEAFAAGAPVAASQLTAVPEAAGDAALLFDPMDPQAIAQAMQRLLEDDALRGRLREAGRDRVQTFTWERTAQATLAVYRQVLSNMRD